MSNLNTFFFFFAYRKRIVVVLGFGVLETERRRRRQLAGEVSGARAGNVCCQVEFIHFTT